MGVEQQRRRCRRCMAALADDETDFGHDCGWPPYPDAFYDQPALGGLLDVVGRYGETGLTVRQLTVLHHDETYFRVGDDYTDDGWRVSTVWAGDIAPVNGPFETMVFDAAGEAQVQTRATNEDDATRTHELMVTLMSDPDRRAAYFGDLEERTKALVTAVWEQLGLEGEPPV